MKKLILFVLTAFSLNAVVGQTKNTPGHAKTPKDTLEAPAVETEDPADVAAWKRQKKNGKAEFSDSTLKKDRTVTYDGTGNMTISENGEEKQDINAYPPSIAEYFTQKYPGEKFRVLWSKDKIGNKIYYIKRKPEVFWFDQDGNFTSKSRSASK